MEKISPELKLKIEDLAKKLDKPIEWVIDELNKGPFSESPIWKLIQNLGLQL